MNLALQILGRPVGVHLPLMDKLAAFFKRNEFRYGYMLANQFEQICKTDLAAGNQILWSEILHMAHEASALSLLRSRGWLLGTIQAIETGNALAFASCFRGYLEGASDTYDSLNFTPWSLIEHHKLIVEAITGRARTFLEIEGIETALVHFLMARELGKKETAPDPYRAKRASDYFKALDKAPHGLLWALYRDLCELTHPSKASLDVFLEQRPDGYQELKLTKGESVIRLIANNHRVAVDTGLLCGINIPLITLKVLNEFPVESLHTPGLDAIYFEDIPLGQRIKAKLGKAKW